MVVSFGLGMYHCVLPLATGSFPKIVFQILEEWEDDGVFFWLRTGILSRGALYFV